MSYDVKVTDSTMDILPTSPPLPAWIILTSIMSVLAVGSIVVYIFYKHRRKFKFSGQRIDLYGVCEKCSSGTG